MNTENPRWDKLVSQARRARDDRPETAPYGFATRVVAQAMAANEGLVANLFERWSWRAIGVAAAFAVVTVAANYSTFTGPADYDLTSDDTSLAAVFDGS